jgi:hypothetical protein
LLLAVCCAGASARAQTPAGPEFRINSYTTGSQQRPAIGIGGPSPGLASLPAFVVTWNSNGQDGSGIGVFGQRFGGTALPLGVEFRVNETTFGNQYQWSSGAGRAPAGAFVAVWNALDNVFGRLHDAAGAPSGGEFLVNTFTTSFQDRATAAVAATGRFVVTWESAGQDGSGRGIFAQRYDASGARQGAEFRVNTATAGSQYRPNVATDAAGNFVVVWDGDTDGSNWGIFGQRFDAGGSPLGAEFRVNTYTTDRQTFPQVARTPTGSFVVVWSSYRQDGSGYGVFGQRFDAAGAPAGAEFRANTYTLFSQGQESVAIDAAGGFVVAWRSYQDGSYDGVFAQRFAPSGAALGAEFRVNTYTTSNQNFPTVRSDAHGNLVFAWNSLGQDGEFFGIYGQRFGGLRPSALSADGGGNGVLEPDEAAAVAPAWLNFNGAALAYGGGVLAFTGPPGGTYTTVDGQASYGTVADGASGSCGGDCYQVSVAAASRPSLHWDGTLLEQLQPAQQHGQTHRWTLHVGDSFTDAPRTNPFYRFIETLLHHGITGGCGGASYCPGDATTRDQMSVFVLIAKEGAGYLPPACAPPNVFTDVPETSAFCRFVEELFNRGVVGGCGPGPAYCPTSPVTRDQMAVFVLRTLDPALDPPACQPPNLFADVPETSAFCRWIEELANRGVVTGCGGGNYCPAAAVTREQMGVFISATFGLALYGA